MEEGVRRGAVQPSCLGLGSTAGSAAPRSPHHAAWRSFSAASHWRANRGCRRVAWNPLGFRGPAFPSCVCLAVSISHPWDDPLSANEPAPNAEISAVAPLRCDPGVDRVMQNRQRVTRRKKSKTVAVSEGGSVSSALLVMVNCCTQARILKQESLCQKVLVALENRWCGSKLIRSGCPVAFVCCQKSQAKITLFSFAATFSQGWRSWVN